MIYVLLHSLRCVVLSAKEAEDKYIAAVHTKNHIDLIKNISSKKFDSRREKIAGKYNSIYFNEGSSEAAYLAAGSVLEVNLFWLAYKIHMMLGCVEGLSNDHA